jgi:hypothetical protein
MRGWGSAKKGEIEVKSRNLKVESNTEEKERGLPLAAGALAEWTNSGQGAKKSSSHALALSEGYRGWPGRR